MKKHMSFASSRTPYAANHLNRDPLVTAVRLGLMYFHASRTSPETAALFALKEAGQFTYPGAVASLRAKIVLRARARL